MGLGDGIVNSGAGFGPGSLATNNVYTTPPANSKASPPPINNHFEDDFSEGAVDGADAVDRVLGSGTAEEESVWTTRAESGNDVVCPNCWRV